MYTFLKYTQPTIHTTLTGDTLGLLWPIGCNISESVSGNKLISSQMRNKKHETDIYYLCIDPRIQNQNFLLCFLKSTLRKREVNTCPHLKIKLVWEQLSLPALQFVVLCPEVLSFSIFQLSAVLYAWKVELTTWKHSVYYASVPHSLLAFVS